MADAVGSGKVRLLGWIHALLAGVGLAGGGFICLGLMADPQGGPALYYMGPLFVAATTVYLAPGFVGGMGLLRGWRWARILVGALSIVLLLLIPVGTLLGGFGLWVLLDRRNLPPPVPPRPAMIVRAERARILGVLAVAACVGAGFVVVIGLGFRLQGQTAPAPIDDALIPATILLVAILAATILMALAPEAQASRPFNPFTAMRRRRAWRRSSETVAEAHR